MLVCEYVNHLWNASILEKGNIWNSSFCEETHEIIFHKPKVVRDGHYCTSTSVQISNNLAKLRYFELGIDSKSQYVNAFDTLIFFFLLKVKFLKDSSHEINQQVLKLGSGDRKVLVCPVFTQQWTTNPSFLT